MIRDLQEVPRRRVSEDRRREEAGLRLRGAPRPEKGLAARARGAEESGAGALRKRDHPFPRELSHGGPRARGQDVGVALERAGDAARGLRDAAPPERELALPGLGQPAGARKSLDGREGAPRRRAVSRLRVTLGQMEEAFDSARLPGQRGAEEDLLGFGEVAAPHLEASALEGREAGRADASRFDALELPRGPVEVVQFLEGRAEVEAHAREERRRAG